jgi:hypothetical protein
MRLVGAGVPLSYAVQAVFTIGAAAVVAVVWRRDVSLPTRAAVLASATLVAVPLSLIYDLMLAAVAACWLMRDRAAIAGWERTVLALLFVLLLDCRNLAEALVLPVAPLAVLSLFAIAARRAWREMAGAVPVASRVGVGAAE